MFLFFSMLLLCSFFRLKELFQVKNGLTKSLLFFFWKMTKIWVGQTMLNGENKRGWPYSITCKLKMLRQIKNRTCKLKIVHAN